MEAAGFLAGLERLMPPVGPAPRGPGPVYERTALKGPMSVFGFDYLAHHLGAGRTAGLRLLRYEGIRGAGAEYAYEVLNFVNGVRTVGEIRDAVSAVYGPVPIELVAEYLEALGAVGAVRAR